MLKVYWMQIYTKYLFKTLTFQFLAILVTLTGIVWITQSMRIVDLIVNKGISFWDFIKISTLLIPYLSFIIIPISVFFSGISVIYKFLLDKELIILKTSGLSNFQVAKPFLYFSLVIMVFSYLVSFYLLPFSYGKFKDLQIHFRNNYASILLEEGVFSSQVNKLTIYVDKKLDDYTYQGIIIYDNRQENNSKMVFAKEGKILRDQNSSWFELYEGSHQEKNLTTGAISVLYFDRYSINFSLLEEEYIRTTEPNEKYISDLFNINPEEENKRNKLISHAHFRLSWPLNSLALMMIAASILITSKYQRKERSFKTFSVGMLGIGILIIFLLVNNLTLHNLNFAILMYLLPVVSTLLSLLKLRAFNLTKNL